MRHSHSKLCEYRFSLLSAQHVYRSFFSCCSLPLKRATRRASGSSETAIAQRPRAPKETLPVTPLLDVDRMNVECNCLSSPETAEIFFGQTLGG